MCLEIWAENKVFRGSKSRRGAHSGSGRAYRWVGMRVHQTLGCTPGKILEFKFLEMFFKQGFTKNH